MPQEFANRFAALPKLNEGLKRRLVEDDIGIVPVPSVYVKEVSKLDVSSFIGLKNLVWAFFSNFPVIEGGSVG